MNSAIKILVLFVGCLAIGCRSEKEPPNYVPTIMKYSELGPPPSSATNLARPISSGPDQLPPQQRLIIKSGRLTCEVNDCDKASSDIQKLVQQMGGFIVTSSTQTYEGSPRSSTIQLRVPASQFEAAIEGVSRLSTKVILKSIGGNDVTEEFVDINARLDNQRRVETRFKEILKSAKSVNDILEVEKSLGEVREEIDHLEGRRKFLADQTALSSLMILLQEPKAFVVLEGDGLWSKIIAGFRRGIREFGNVLSLSITILIASIPAILIVALIVFVVLKVLKSIKSKSAVEKEANKRMR